MSLLPAHFWAIELDKKENVRCNWRQGPRFYRVQAYSTNVGQLTSAITVPSTRHDLSCFYLGTFRDGKKLKMKWPAHTCGESEVDEVSDVMLP